jgi:hypothetical protein
MLAAEHCSDISTCGALPRTELLEVHRSKISVHHAKAGYNYSAIRLPFTFSALAGLSTRIYQTVHDGALAFLVVVSSSHKGEEGSQKKSETFATSSRYSPLQSEGRAFESPRAHRLFFQSGARIRVEAEHDKDDELCNYKRKLCNFRIADDNESRARIMTDRYVDEEGNERIELLLEELVPEAANEIDWEDPNDPYNLEVDGKLREALKRDAEKEAEE